MTLTTPPEINPCIKVIDDVFTVGNYVEVIGKHSKGFKRPPSCGYVLRVIDKVINVKYAPTHDSTKRHANIPLSKELPVILHQGMMIPIKNESERAKNIMKKWEQK